MMTRREVAAAVVGVAEPIYGEREARQLARIVLEELCDTSWSSYILDPDSECQTENLDKVLHEIGTGRPIQQIVGRCEFYGVELTIREGVLIPRPESEELVGWVVSDFQEVDKELRIVDLCSGSGALAIALSHALPTSEVVAVELSEEAIAVAQENIAQTGSTVRLVKGDVLNCIESLIGEGFDVIISNPPYIPIRERSQMQVNVVDFEPSMALFVPDDDPLLFYRAIAQSGLRMLNHGGRVYFEVHDNYAVATSELLTSMGYEDVCVRCDINDKPRMVCGVRV